MQQHGREGRQCEADDCPYKDYKHSMFHLPPLLDCITEPDEEQTLPDTKSEDGSQAVRGHDPESAWHPVRGPMYRREEVAQGPTPSTGQSGPSQSAACEGIELGSDDTTSGQSGLDDDDDEEVEEEEEDMNSSVNSMSLGSVDTEPSEGYEEAGAASSSDADMEEEED